jgi:hypothetical protein
VLVGGAHRQVSAPGRRGCQSLPHRVEPFSDSPALVGGMHRQASTSGRVTPTAATPCGAISGLARVGGRRAPASVHVWTGRGASCRPPPHRAEPYSDSPALVGGTHGQACTPGLRGLYGRRWQFLAPGRRVGCRLLPHRAEPFLSSPTTVGGTLRQASTPRWRGCRSPPHCVEPFPDLPAKVGGVHRQSSSPTRQEKRNEEDVSMERAASADIVVRAFALGPV